MDECNSFMLNMYNDNNCSFIQTECLKTITQILIQYQTNSQLQQDT